MNPSIKKLPIFVTGNEKKAEYLGKYLGIPLEHARFSGHEIQSLSLEEIVKHKAKMAFDFFQKPVLVEDASLEIYALGRLPGPFIKFFLEEIGENGICDLLLGKENRSATAKTVYGYYDGVDYTYFEASHSGYISTAPRGKNGYGFDRIYEPLGYDGKTRAELDSGDHEKNYLEIKPLRALKEYLQAITL